MTGDVKAGAVVLVAGVAATILWLALRPEPRHDRMTRARAERLARAGIDPECIRRSHCRAVAGHWHCTTELIDGRTLRSPQDPHAPATAFVFLCGG